MLKAIFKSITLFAGDSFRVTMTVLLKAGAQYPMGSVLAFDPAEGLFELVDSASETAALKVPFAVLAEDVDATDGNKPSIGYVTGEFNQDVLTFGGTDTHSTHLVAARDRGLFFKPVSRQWEADNA